MMTMLRTLAAAAILTGALWAAHTHAQPDTAPIDVFGEWVGIIEWDYSTRSGGAPGDVQLYRLNIAQDGTQLHARHLTDGADVLFTHPVANYAEPARGFEGSINGDSIVFPAVSIITGHCTITITLHHAAIGDDPVLIGGWARDPIVIPTPQFTPAPDDRAPDLGVGCGSPTNGEIVLRRFDREVGA